MIDGALLIKTLLEANWDADKTNSRTPEFRERYEDRAIIPFQANLDEVIVYDRNSNASATSVGNAARLTRYRISTEFRTQYSKNHSYLMEKEIKSIIRSNVSYSVPGGVAYGDSGQQVTIEDKDTQYFSGREREENSDNFTTVIELELTSWNEAI